MCYSKMHVYTIKFIFLERITRLILSKAEKSHRTMTYNPMITPRNVSISL